MKTLRAASALLSLLVASPLLGEPLTLRISDAEARPGQEVALTLRTYAPRPVSQGQLSLKAKSTAAAQQLTLKPRGVGASPFAALNDVVVWSSADDALVQASLDGPSQNIVLDFSSASSGVNAVEGPLAVFLLELAPGVTPGDVFSLELDLDASSLLDEHGMPVPLDVRAGLLTILPTNAPFSVEIEGGDVEPGAVAHIGLVTQEVRPFDSGHFVVLYDAAIAAALPQARVDSRYGNALLTVSHPEAGVLVVDFESPDLTFNTLPGAVVVIDLPTTAANAVGSHSEVSLHAETTLLDGDGLEPTLVLESDVLSFVALFRDGFETGDLSAWQ